LSLIFRWFSRFLLLSLFLFILLVVYVICWTIHVGDGLEYKKSDWYDYYNLTPDLIKNAPAASETAIYSVSETEGASNSEQRVTWTGVKDVPRAVRDLDAYLVKEGIDVDAEFNRGNQYFVMHYDDVVILKIGICHSDCRRSNEY